jgi:hypothetical protein
MKLISKRASLIVLVLAAICLMTRYVLCYWCGYYQKSFAPIFWQELFALLGFILFLILSIVWIISLLQRKHRLWITTMLAGLLAFMGLKFILPQPHDLILYEMRDGMLRNYELDDMRHFARDIDELTLPSTILAGTRIFMHQDLDSVKTRLNEKYPFLAQCESIAETDGVVNVDWGGFENHWGGFSGS